MPKLLTWHDEWSLNIETLDQDHRELIAELADICLRFCPESGYALVADAKVLMDALTQFGESVRAHFKREEAFMRSFDYEFIGEHESEHALLMAEFTALLRDWRQERLQVFDEAHQAIIRDWLLAHILGADRHFAETYFRLFGMPVPAKQLHEMRLYQSSYRTGRE
ncbi:hemerythrin family protein [Caldichromatium japonicum]|uniref:Hemerythrin family protein n=1 Tax=Caldichromatium japonicum TaxID=2699430 RepID=A0A6G7VFF8_9GAMM|nr:hemerythrin domain-containing protein [Caldichromatium japonicum]QIK38527.1 hemerythrin family protein [Caldichromatium japonicum]